MSDFPYTEDQVQAFATATGRSAFDAMGDLFNLHDAGVKVSIPQPHTPPQPQYYLEWSRAGQSWRLINRGSRLDVPGAPAGTIASFYGVQGEILAHDCLARLNGEDVR